MAVSKDMLREDGKPYYVVSYGYKGLRHQQHYGHYLDLQEAKDLAAGLVAGADQATAAAQVLWYAAGTDVPIKVFRAWRDKRMSKGNCYTADIDPKTCIPPVPQGLIGHARMVQEKSEAWARGVYAFGVSDDQCALRVQACRAAIKAGIHPLRVELLDRVGQALGTMSMHARQMSDHRQGSTAETILRLSLNHALDKI